MIFSHPKLIEFLRNIKENYTVTSLNNWNGENGIILRHDVDFDLNAAYELAKIEREIGVESTFYIMCSSQMYNPISQKNQDIIKKIDSSYHFSNLFIRHHWAYRQTQNLVMNDFCNWIACI